MEHQKEAEFQSSVVDYARVNGWLVFHDNDPKRDEPGFPDLVIAKGGVVLIWELKSENGRVSTRRRQTKLRQLPSQRDWVEATGAEVLRPRDWAYIEARLGGLR